MPILLDFFDLSTLKFTCFILTLVALFLTSFIPDAKIFIKKEGKKNFNWIGVIILIVGLLSAYVNWEIEKNSELVKETRINYMYDRIAGSMNGRLRPFDFLYSHSKEVFDFNDSVNSNDPWRLFSNWQNTNFKKSWDRIYIFEPAGLKFSSLSWEELFLLNRNDFRKEITLLKSEFNNDIDTELRTLLDSLLIDTDLKSREVRLPVIIGELTLEENEKLRPPYRIWPSLLKGKNMMPYDAYSNYLQKIKKVYIKINRVPEISSYE